ncbi:hypothetical protein [Streptomyces sp. NPDC059863]|uniref:hypothetical protein n=1 Tax=unclassified Streptomyces TaxID=2593676 RepID=UPI00364763E3
MNGCLEAGHAARAVDHFYAARDGNRIPAQPFRFDIQITKADQIGPNASAKVGSAERQKASPQAIGIHEAEHAE